MALRDPAFLDSKSYGFEWLRLLANLHLGPGVLSVVHFKATAAAAGGMRVDISSGIACVRGDTGTPGTGVTQGLYMVTNDANVTNAVTFDASDPTNPRLDQVFLRVNDSSDLGSTGDNSEFVIVKGTPTSGATLDNRNGAGAALSNAIRLADVLIPAGSTAVTAGNIRDRRPQARGFVGGTQKSTQSTVGTASSTVVSITGEFNGGSILVVANYKAQRTVQNNGTPSSMSVQLNRQDFNTQYGSNELHYTGDAYRIVGETMTLIDNDGGVGRLKFSLTHFATVGGDWDCRRGGMIVREFIGGATVSGLDAAAQ